MTVIRMRWLLLACIGASLAGCFSIGLGGEGTALAQYRLDDLSPKVQPRATPIDRRLLLATLPSESIGDTYSMAFTKAAQQRQYYQFASWTDRPSARVVHLLAERIEARGIFDSVGRLGSGVGGGLILNVGVNEVIHDVSNGTAKIEVTAELIERRGRNLVERKRFSASAPVAQENAPGAVAALSRALTTVLDEMVPWLERTADALPPPEPRPSRDGKS
ncbi:MAG TPA: ABC-type transport auxiliary lipoprotein family protein [Burkholderiaceae bacterium]|jgi:cholesterol transport system auxiliary component|nr:ABC-type transport auxiliary lipoprotein family protein [Burkholderiaceae bacterium]